MRQCKICLQKNVPDEYNPNDKDFNIYIIRYNIKDICPSCYESALILFNMDTPGFIVWLIEHDMRNENDEIIEQMRRDFGINESDMENGCISNYIESLENYTIYLENIFLNRGKDAPKPKNI